MKGTLHWVSARHAVDAEVRDYETLFLDEEPDWTGRASRRRSTRSLAVRTGAKLEPLADAAVGERFQLERLGYYCIDPDSAPGSLVLNRTATLAIPAKWRRAADRVGRPPQGKKKNKQTKQKREEAR